MPKLVKQKYEESFLFFNFATEPQKLSNSWRIDETYVKVKGKDRYLYRAIYSNGNTLDMWLRNHRDTVSTKAFIKRLIRDYGQPRSIDG